MTASVKPLVLIVEDNAVVRKVAQLNLTKLGVETHQAVNGLQAVEMCKLHSYDLILMDIAMPEMNGLRATELIREAERETCMHVPIVAITAAGNREDCLNAGMDDYIIKPPDYDRVLRKWLPNWFQGMRA